MPTQSLDLLRFAISRHDERSDAQREQRTENWYCLLFSVLCLLSSIAVFCSLSSILCLLVRRFTKDRLESRRHFFEHFQNRRVELTWRILKDDLHRRGMGKCGLVQPPATKTIINISNSDDSRSQRDRTTRQAIGIARPIVPLVVRSRNVGGHFQKCHAFLPQRIHRVEKCIGTDRRVHLDHQPVFRSEAADFR